ncbi:MAG: hypothetical protein WAN20_13740 [Pseudonocardiaceae bacterium]
MIIAFTSSWLDSGGWKTEIRIVYFLNNRSGHRARFGDVQFSSRLGCEFLGQHHSMGRVRQLWATRGHALLLVHPQFSGIAGLNR